MIRQTKNFTSALVLIASAALLTVLAAGCTEPDKPGEKHLNREPESRLSNVPPPGTVSTSPLVTLSWLGDDADGFVVAYRYRWSFQLDASSPVEYKPYKYILNIMIGGLALMIDGNEQSAPSVYKYFSTLPPEGLDTARLNSLARGDTVVFEGVPVWASNPDDERYPEHESPSSGTFIFDSQDSLNPHVFEVSAIDNNGAVDTSPATVDFTTPIVPPPDVQVLSGPRDTVLVLNELTDTYRGTTFTFRGIDPNSRTIEYSWIVDRDEWPEGVSDSKWSPFSLEPTATVKGSDFPNSLQTHHRIYVRARNEFGSISTKGFFTRPGFDSLGNAVQDTFWAYLDFNTIYPTLAIPGSEKRILIIMNIFNWDTLAVPPYKPDKAAVEQYYREMYDALGLAGKYDFFHVRYNASLSGTWPGLGLIGQYSLIHVVGDVVNDFYRFPTISPGSQGKITDFCNVGGKFMINGWNVTSDVNLQPSAVFWNNILHIQNRNPAIAKQFVGVRHQVIPGDDQYPDASVDTAKSNLDTAWVPGLPTLATYQAYGFGEIIYRYDSHDDVPFLENGVIGIRYIGLTYDVIFNGFPLYYMEQPAAIEVLRKSLRDLKHLAP